jgi:diguanylate cyclase (GGDEF)-like protein
MRNVTPTALRVILLDHGADGSSDAIRQLLAPDPSLAVSSVTVRNRELGERAGVSQQGAPLAADIIVLNWDATCDLATAIASARRAVPDAALVVVVPWPDRALFLSAIRHGAEDCVALSRLDAHEMLRVLAIAAERHRLTATLRVAAFTDELTGLYNRRGYVTRAAALLKVADPKTIWQIFFDVDELKLINDTFGHWAGDRALMEVAAVLRQAFRSTDIVARVGGDEFAVLAIAPADAAPDSWAARWREPLAALATRRDLPLSVSVGLAQPDEQGQMSPDDLLTRADMTMYTAKRLRKKLADSASARSLGSPLALVRG